MNQHHFLTTFIWYALNVNANQMKILLRRTKKCLNHVFLLEPMKNYRDGKILRQKLLRGPTTWKGILKNAWKGIVNRRTKRQSNCIRFQVLVWTIIKSQKEGLESVGELSEVCSQIVFKSLYLARSGRLDNLCGQSINLPDESQNGLKRVPEVWPDKIHFSITPVTTVNVVMWETPHSIADLGYFKTQTLLEILKIRNQVLEEFCIFLVLAHLCPSIGCAKKQTSA